MALNFANDLLTKYQRKITNYDRTYMGLSDLGSWKEANLPKFGNTAHSDLIDVDLVRGSAFPKVKSREGWLIICRDGFMHVLAFPLYLSWWFHKTSAVVTIFFSLLYILSLAQFGIYFSKLYEAYCVCEIFSPILLSLILGVLYTKITETHYSHKSTRRSEFKQKKISHGSDAETSSTSTPDSRRRILTRFKDAVRSPSNDSQKCRCCNASRHVHFHQREYNNSKEERSGIEGDIETNCSDNDQTENSKRNSSDLEVPNNIESLELGPNDKKTYDVLIGKADTVLNNVKAAPVEPVDRILQLDNRNLDGCKELNDDTHSDQRKLKQPRFSPDRQWRYRRSGQRATSAEPELTESPQTRKAYCISCRRRKSWLDQLGSSGESDNEDESQPRPGVISEMDSEYPIQTESSDSSGNESSDEGSPQKERDPPSSNLGSKISCMLWEKGEGVKSQMSMLDIASSIIKKVNHYKIYSEHILVAVIFSLIYTTLPLIFRLYPSFTLVGLNELLITGSQSANRSLDHTFYTYLIEYQYDWTSLLVLTVGCLQRFVFSSILLGFLCLADRTFQERLLYAKHFCYLTSLRRAEKYGLPHFRLNKVHNIKTWLTLRSFVKHQGPQHSVDAIVSATFMLTVALVSALSIQLLQESDQFMTNIYDWDLIIWCLADAYFLLRFMTIGTMINKKYRNPAILITEQINMYLRMEQKPQKKEKLMLANSVLKLAEELIKELEHPFKISGISANPFLYNITKLVILSAFSAVLSDLFGFKLKLYKIKFNT